MEIDAVERTDGATYFQRAKDISETGVFLAGTLAHPPGTRVSLSLKLPGATEPMTVEGTVVARSADELGMAVSFSAPIALARPSEKSSSNRLS